MLPIQHIDWEIHAAMFNTENNPRMGILVLNLPTINNWSCANNDREKQMINENGIWHSFSTRQEYEMYYPYLPSRIIDNLIKKVSITIIDWNIIKNIYYFVEFIDFAFSRRKSNEYDHSAPLRRNNTGNNNNY